MLLAFDTFSFMFMIVFVIVLVLVIASVIVNFYRTLHRPQQTISTEPASVVKEREIIREIVKIRCPYCNNLYEEKYDKCPTAEANEHPKPVRLDPVLA